jgi:predicted NodU family carbamoyl transferase
MFYKETGVPMLLNTSFNLAGMPLVSKEEMLEKTMNNSKIDFLFRLKDNNV